MANRKIIHVHFLNGRKNYYFGCVAAVFEMFTEEDIGCSESYLRHILNSDGSTYLSDKVYCIRSRLIGKSKVSKV